MAPKTGWFCAFCRRLWLVILTATMLVLALIGLGEDKSIPQLY